MNFTKSDIANLFILFVPIGLLVSGIIPFSLRFYILTFMGGVYIIYSHLLDFSFKDLGISRINFVLSLITNAAVSLALTIIIVLFYYLDFIRTPSIPEDRTYFFLFYVLISCPIQEFIFRGYIYAYLKKRDLLNGRTYILVSSLSYSFIHIIYFDGLTLLVTFLIGLLWGYLFYKYKNVFGVILSHVILGIISIVTGII